MAKPRVFVSRLIAKKGLDLICDFCETAVWDGELPPAQDVLMARARDCEGLLTLLTENVDQELIDGAAKLKVISNMAVGGGNNDIGAAPPAKIPGREKDGVVSYDTA